MREGKTHKGGNDLDLTSPNSVYVQSKTEIEREKIQSRMKYPSYLTDRPMQQQDSFVGREVRMHSSTTRKKRRILVETRQQRDIVGFASCIQQNRGILTSW